MSNATSTTQKPAIITLWSENLCQTDNCLKVLEVKTIKEYPYITVSTIKTVAGATDPISTRKQVLLTLYQWRQLLGKAFLIDRQLSEVIVPPGLGLKVLAYDILATVGPVQKRVQLVGLDGKVFISLIEFWCPPKATAFVPTHKSVFLTPVEWRLLLQKALPLQNFLEFSGYQGGVKPGI